MLDKITRTLTVTIINFSEVIVENGVPTFRACDDEVLPGEIADDSKVTQYLRKKYGAGRLFVVTGMTTSTKKYEMDLATFIAAATHVTTAEKKARKSRRGEEQMVQETIPGLDADASLPGAGAAVQQTVPIVEPSLAAPFQVQTQPQEQFQPQTPFVFPTAPAYSVPVQSPVEPVPQFAPVASPSVAPGGIPS